jgi:hypothetical protein
MFTALVAAMLLQLQHSIPKGTLQLASSALHCIHMALSSNVLIASYIVLSCCFITIQQTLLVGCSHRILRRYEAVGGSSNRLRPLSLAEALRLPEVIVTRDSGLDKSR